MDAISDHVAVAIARVPAPECILKWVFTVELCKCECAYTVGNDPGKRRHYIDSAISEAIAAMNETRIFLKGADKLHTKLTAREVYRPVKSITIDTSKIIEIGIPMLDDISRYVYPWGPIIATYTALRMSFTPFIYAGLVEQGKYRWHEDIRKGNDDVFIRISDIQGLVSDSIDISISPTQSLSTNWFRSNPLECLSSMRTTSTHQNWQQYIDRINTSVDYLRKYNEINEYLSEYFVEDHDSGFWYPSFLC
jgi:hypothetical protein